MVRWRPLSPVAWSWTDDDPDDPDFVVEFAVAPGDRVRVRSRLPLALAQRAFRKPPGVSIEPRGEGYRVRVMVGLTRVHALFGQRLDRALASLVDVRAARGEAGDAFEVASASAVEVRVPRAR